MDEKPLQLFADARRRINIHPVKTERFDLDVNPGIALDINDAIAEAVEHIAQVGYLDEEATNILIAATSRNR